MNIINAVMNDIKEVYEGTTQYIGAFQAKVPSCLICAIEGSSLIYRGPSYRGKVQSLRTRISPAP